VPSGASLVRIYRRAEHGMARVDLRRFDYFLLKPNSATEAVCYTAVCRRVKTATSKRLWTVIWRDTTPELPCGNMTSGTLT
jgi:hypothetical protein